MAYSRPKRLFTSSEVIESIFTAGSGDEIDDRDYESDLEDDSGLLRDVLLLDLVHNHVTLNLIQLLTK